MIPKTIHYCWFGGGEKSKLIQKCIKSWKRVCPEYTITEWNESNFDFVTAPAYVRQAYAAKKWAIASDYARLKILYENGGIYLDTDVELIRPLTDLLGYAAFFGTESAEIVSTGLGFGSEAGLPILEKMMRQYEALEFDEETLLACPYIDTPVFEALGWQKDGTKQLLPENILVLPKEYFCPKDYMTGVVTLTENTRAIHHYTATWQTKEKQKLHGKQLRHNRRVIAREYIRHIPNRALQKLLGKDRYQRLKEKLKRQK